MPRSFRSLYESSDTQRRHSDQQSPEDWGATNTLDPWRLRCPIRDLGPTKRVVDAAERLRHSKAYLKRIRLPLRGRSSLQPMAQRKQDRAEVPREERMPYG